MENLTNICYLKLLNTIISNGREQTCRNNRSLELIGNKTTISMNQPLLTLKGRNLGYRFALAEAAWVLQGDNKVENLKPYSKIIEKFSDDGITFFGAYGPPIVDQIEYIGRAFKKDLFTRRAVMSLWRLKPPESFDIPCTISVQFLLRPNKYNLLELDIINYMRSSDAWLGIPYDWFTFSMLGAYIAIYLKTILKMDLLLGDLTIMTGSQHLYVNSFGYTLPAIKNLLIEEECSSESQELFQYEPIILSQFEKPSDLIKQLNCLVKNKMCLDGISWLKELIPVWNK